MIRAAAATTAAFTWWDVLAAVIVVSLVPVVEWVVHSRVLHAEPRKIGSWTVDFGAGHRNHHRYPNSIYGVVLAGGEAAAFQLLDVLTVATVVGVPFAYLGAPVVGPVLTGSVFAIASLFYYEWLHFLFHTPYRPKSTLYRRLKRNHRYHHFRNENYWLGVTSNVGDRLWGTYAVDGSDVPTSATVKTLGIEEFHERA